MAGADVHEKDDSGMTEPDGHYMQFHMKGQAYPRMPEELMDLANLIDRKKQKLDGYDIKRDEVAEKLGWEVAKVDRAIEQLLAPVRDLKLDVNLHLVDVPGKLEPKAEITMADTVTPKRPAWTWRDRIPEGKITLLVGPVGSSKTMIALALAAHISRGAPWPVDKLPCKRGKVLIISAEDSIEDTLVPRLIAAGADLHNIGFLDEIEDYDPDTGEKFIRYLSLKKDISTLRNKIIELKGCRLVIVDPISAYLDGTDSHNNAEVRSALMPLSKLAGEMKVAIILISHMNKNERGQNALNRTLASVGFVAVARSVIYIIPDHQIPERRLFIPAKANLSALKHGYAYRVIQTESGAATVQWETEPCNLSADLALALKEGGGLSKIDDAIEWLEGILASGPIEINEILTQGKTAGHLQKTLERAKDVMNLKISKKEFQGKSFWEIRKDSHPYTPLLTALDKSEDLSQSDDHVDCLSKPDLAALDESKAGQGKQADRPLRQSNGDHRDDCVREPSEKAVRKMCRATVKGKQVTEDEFYAEIMKAPEDIPILLSDPQCARTLAEGLEKRLMLEEKHGGRF